MTSMPPPPPEHGKIPSFSSTAPASPASSLRSSLKPPTVGGVPKLPNKKVLLEDLEKATPIPIVIASLALVLSIIIWIINRHSSLFLSAVGYCLSPFIVIMCLGLDTFLQRRKTSAGDWFIPNHSFGVILRAMTLFALILSYPHVSGLADHISAWLAQVFPWMAS